MKSIQMDQTDLRLSRLAFGTASLHHLFQSSWRQNLLASALAAGITHFDTSPYYGYGLAELDLGAFIRGRRGAVTIATKVGLYPPGSAARGSLSVWLRKAAGGLYRGLSAPSVDWRIATAERSLNASLKRLKTDYVDILFLHEPDRALIDSDAFLAWLEAALTKGKIRYWGLAGLPASLESWVAERHPLAAVLQCKDSLSRKESDIILRLGRKLQFTYGYLSGALREGIGETAESALRRALERNTDGSILISSRRLDHLKKLSAVVG